MTAKSRKLTLVRVAMQKTDSLPILLIHLALLFFGQVLLILLVQITMQFVILQDRLPAEMLTGKSFDEVVEIQKEISLTLTEDLEKDPTAVATRYYEIVFKERNGILFWSSLLWAFAFILPGYYILGKRMEIPISRLDDGFQMEWIFKGIAGGVAVFFMMALVSIVINQVSERPKNNEFQTMLFTSLKGNGTLLAWSLYSVGLVTGIIEEWFFRGMLLKHFISKGFVKEGLIITSVLFGGLHYSPEASIIIPVLLSGVGLFFGYLYLKYGNIWVPIFAHATYNSIGLIAAYFMGDMVT